MNLPNKLTIARILLTFVFLYFISRDGLVAMALAAAAFVVASVTDFLDGYIAKKYNLVSDFGKLMDPIADKFLMLAAFLAFVRLHIIAEWMVVVIFGREFIITGLRIFAMTRGKVLAAEKAGKHKTVSQVISVFAILGFVVVREYLSSVSRWSYDLERGWLLSINVLMVITVVLTLTSGLSYLWNNRKVIRV